MSEQFAELRHMIITAFQVTVRVMMVYDAFRRLIFNAVQKYKTLLIPFPRVCGIQHYSLGNGFIAR